MEDKMKYTCNPDNCNKIYEFIGEQKECEICGGYGEYEDNGPHGCAPCCSRLIFFIDKNGKRVGADWGDTIVKDDDGLSLILGHDYD